MWVLKFLPDWVFYGLTLVGFVGIFFSKFIPAYYRTAVLPIAAAFFVLGVYMSGAISNEAWWQAKVKELEEKIAVAEQESKQAIDKLTTKLETKSVVIEQRKIESIKYIEVEREKIDATCTVPQEFIFIVNKAADQPQ